MRAICTTLLSMIATSFGVHNASFSLSITNLLDTLLDNYDRKIRPDIDEGKPVSVTVHISVLNIGPVSEKDMEFTMDCYFRQIWFDSRLQFRGPLSTLSLASKVLKDIWRPDTYIRNGRQSYLHTLTVPNILLRVREDGRVYISQRLTIKTRCPMYLKKFPMDTQICPVYLGSLGYNTNDVVYNWVKVDMNPKIDLSQYEIKKSFTHERNISDPLSLNEYPLSTLEAYFVLERQQGFYILQMYTPCSLIVVMSWVSFWINKEASPARVGLGIMTVLTMSTLGLGGRDDLPKISYSTALDLYIVACFGFVFASLVEYAVINFAYMVAVGKRREQLRLMYSTDLCDEDGALQSTFAETKPRLCCPQRLSRSSSELKKNKEMMEYSVEEGMLNVERIDAIAKVMFPMLYGTFNLLYWCSFLYWIPDEIHQHVDVPKTSGY